MRQADGALQEELTQAGQLCVGEELCWGAAGDKPKPSGLRWRGLRVKSESSPLRNERGRDEVGAMPSCHGFKRGVCCLSISLEVKLPEEGWPGKNRKDFLRPGAGLGGSLSSRWPPLHPGARTDPRRGGSGLQSLLSQTFRRGMSPLFSVSLSGPPLYSLPGLSLCPVWTEEMGSGSGAKSLDCSASSGPSSSGVGSGGRVGVCCDAQKGLLCLACLPGYPQPCSLPGQGSRSRQKPPQAPAAPLPRL